MSFFRAPRTAILLQLLLIASAQAVAFSPVATGPGYAFSCGPSLSRAHPFERYGPRYVFKSEPRPANSARLGDRRDLKVMSYNFGGLETNGLKPQTQLEGLIRNVVSEKPDVIVGLEIESLEAMSAFDKQALGDAYFRVMVPGNERSFSIGFFVRKDLGADIEVQSYRELNHEYLGAKKRVFTRDFPVISLREAGSADDADPVLILGGIHLKAKRRSNVAGDADPSSDIKRTGQAQAVADILTRYDRHYGGRVTVMAMGDANAAVPTAPELAPLRNSVHKDVFDVRGLPRGSLDRSTHTMFENFGSAPTYSQLDAAYVSPAGVAKVVDAHVVKELDANGRPLALPRTFEERRLRASDHRAISVTLDLMK